MDKRKEEILPKLEFIQSLYPTMTLRVAEIIYYTVFEGKSQKEIGAILGISVRTVKNTLYQISEEKFPKLPEIQVAIFKALWENQK